MGDIMCNGNLQTKKKKKNTGDKNEFYRRLETT